MIVSSTRFGDIDIPDDRALDFGPGLLGFPEGQHYVIVEIEDDEDYFWLQSVEIADVAFLCIRPWDFFPDYEIDVPDDTAAQIGLDDPVDSEVFLLLTTHHDADDQLSSITANLLGPVVVNTNTRQGRQVVLDSSVYSTREPLLGAA